MHLTPTEYALLKYLAVHAGKVLTHTMILNEVWGAGYNDSAVLRTCHEPAARQAGRQRREAADPHRTAYRLPAAGARRRELTKAVS